MQQLENSRRIATVEHGDCFLIAEKVVRGPSADLILSWTTSKSAYQLMADCSAVQHDDVRLPRIEIIADDRLLAVETLRDLREQLRDPSIVRFNFGDWSVTWLAGTSRQLPEVQATTGSVPPGVTDMVLKSVKGITRREVEKVFELVRDAA